jgi:hypothetical protein
MIKLIDKGPDESVIEFDPRPRSKVRTITRELVYGHVCKWCGNVIQAFFLTKEEVNLKEYEETRVISQGGNSDGTLQKIVPNSDDPMSGYKVDFYPTSKGNAQLIRLKNHLINWKGMSSGDKGDFFETGPRCCKFVGVTSHNDGDLLAEVAMVLGYTNRYCSLIDLKIPTSYVAEYKSPYSWMTNPLVLVPVVGKGNPVLLTPRDAVKNQADQSYFFNTLVDQWKEKLKTEQALLQTTQP